MIQTPIPNYDPRGSQDVTRITVLKGWKTPPPWLPPHDAVPPVTTVMAPALRATTNRREVAVVPESAWFAFRVAGRPHLMLAVTTDYKGNAVLASSVGHKLMHLHDYALTSPALALGYARMALVVLIEKHGLDRVYDQIKESETRQVATWLGTTYNAGNKQ